MMCEILQVFIQRRSFNKCVFGGLEIIGNWNLCCSYFTGSFFFPSADMSQQYLGKMGGVANESTVEILYQLGTVQDTWTADRYVQQIQYRNKLKAL